MRRQLVALGVGACVAAATPLARAEAPAPRQASPQPPDRVDAAGGVDGARAEEAAETRAAVGVPLVIVGGVLVTGAGGLAAVAATVESMDDPFEPTNATPWWVGTVLAGATGAICLVGGIVVLSSGPDHAVEARLGPARGDLRVTF